MHEIDVEVAQESQDEQIETESIDSVHLNKNQSVITAYLDTFVGENMVKIPYKINRGSGGNIMLIYIFKQIFKNTMTEQQVIYKKSHQALNI